jgi:hypothetical protein
MGAIDMTKIATQMVQVQAAKSGGRRDGLVDGLLGLVDSIARSVLSDMHTFVCILTSRMRVFLVSKVEGTEGRNAIGRPFDFRVFLGANHG